MKHRKSAERQFSNRAGTKGQLRRIDGYGQWESGKKRLMGLTKYRSTKNRYPTRPFGWLRNNLLNLPVYSKRK